MRDRRSMQAHAASAHAAQHGARSATPPPISAAAAGTGALAEGDANTADESAAAGGGEGPETNANGPGASPPGPAAAGPTSAVPAAMSAAAALLPGPALRLGLVEAACCPAAGGDAGVLYDKSILSECWTQMMNVVIGHNFYAVPHTHALKEGASAIPVGCRPAFMSNCSAFRLRGTCQSSETAV